MKLYLEKNSIRLILSPKDMDQFKMEKILREDIRIGEYNSFSFVLAYDQRETSLTAYFSCDMLTISAPNSIFDRWFDSNLSSISGKIKGVNEEIIEILLETDDRA